MSMVLPEKAFFVLNLHFPVFFRDDEVFKLERTLATGVRISIAIVLKRLAQSQAGN